MVPRIPSTLFRTREWEMKNGADDSVSTLRSALELKSVFERLQAAEQSGMSPEDLRKLEEQAAEQGMRTLWKGAKLEVESVIRETCDRVLGDPSVSREKRDLRAAALGLMGEVSCRGFLRCVAWR